MKNIGLLQNSSNLKSLVRRQSVDTQGSLGNVDLRTSTEMSETRYQDKNMFLQTAIPRTRNPRKFTATSMDNYTKGSAEFQKGQLPNPIIINERATGYHTAAQSKLATYDTHRESNYKQPQQVLNKFDSYVKKPKTLMPIDASIQSWTKPGQAEIGGKEIPSTVRVQNDLLVQPRCGTSLANSHVPLDFDRRLFNQSVDFDRFNPTTANGVSMGLNIKTDKMLAFYAPGHNQKQPPVTAINQGLRKTERSDSGRAKKEALYRTIGGSGFDLENDKNLRSPQQDNNNLFEISPKTLHNRSTAIGSERKYKMSVREMVVSGFRELPQEYQIDDGKLRGEFQVPYHHVDPDMRFNFPNKGYRVPQGKLRRYMDTHMTAKSKIPSPDKYINDLNFLNVKKRMTIYPFNRRTFIEKTIAEGKKVPGVASYDITKYDERYVKPPTKAIMDLKEERYTKFDEIKFLQKQMQTNYNQVPIEKIRKKTVNFKIRQQTAIEKEVAKRSTDRNNSPSPVTYKTQEVVEKTQWDRANFNMTIGRAKKRPYFEGVQEKAKKIPGPANYNAHLSLDKVARPMKKF